MTPREVYEVREAQAERLNAKLTADGFRHCQARVASKWNGGLYLAFSMMTDKILPNGDAGILHSQQELILPYDQMIDPMAESAALGDALDRAMMACAKSAKQGGANLLSFEQAMVHLAAMDARNAGGIVTPSNGRGGRIIVPESI